MATFGLYFGVDVYLKKRSSTELNMITLVLVMIVFFGMRAILAVIRVVTPIPKPMRRSLDNDPSNPRFRTRGRSSSTKDNTQIL